MDDARTERNDVQWAVGHYFAAVVAFSAPFWLVSFVFPWEPLPGLPVSSLMSVVPGIVAFVFVARAMGRHRAISWLRQVSTLPSATRSHWLVVAVLMPPAVLAAAYTLMLFAGHQLPGPEFDIASALTLLALFFIPGALEELGWSCFAVATLQRRMSALGASLLVGGVWAVWHVIPLLQADRSMDWIVWWGATTVGLRILTTWILNNTSGTLIPVALFHASENTSWQSFPVRGSHYDPAFHALCLWAVCAVIVIWFGWKTLTRPEHKNPKR